MPVSERPTALAWLLAGSTVTQVVTADVRDRRLIQDLQVPVRLSATFGPTTAPGPSAHRRIEAILGQLYGGSWVGRWESGAVSLANTSYDRGGRELGGA